MSSATSPLAEATSTPATASGNSGQADMSPGIGGQPDLHAHFPTSKSRTRKKASAAAEVPHVPAHQFFQSTVLSSISLPIRTKTTKPASKPLSLAPQRKLSSQSDQTTQPHISNSVDAQTPRADDKVLLEAPAGDSARSESTAPAMNQNEKQFNESQQPQTKKKRNRGLRRKAAREAGLDQVSNKNAAEPHQEDFTKPEVQQPSIFTHQTPTTRNTQSTAPFTPERLSNRWGDERRFTLPRPVPHPFYMANVAQGYQQLPLARSILVILDLNGVLVYRRPRSKTGHVPRLDLGPFLDYLFANHHVMIWSSGMPANVRNICERVFTPEQLNALIDIWGRDTLRLTSKQMAQNVQVYKQLSWVFSDPLLQRKAGLGNAMCSQAVGTYDQSNTVLIDDTAEKALAEPWNLLRVDEFMGNVEGAHGEKGVLMQVVEYLEGLRWASDVSAYMHQNPFKMTSL